MNTLTLDAMILIACAVCLGGIVSAYIADSWFQGSSPTVHGTRAQLFAIRVFVWSAVIASGIAFILLASTRNNGITVVAVLFGLQALLLDFAVRIQYRQIEGCARDLAAISRPSDPRLSRPWGERGPYRDVQEP